MPDGPARRPAPRRGNQNPYCHDEHKGRNGYRRITAVLCSLTAEQVNHKCVQRLMQKMGLRALIQKRRRSRHVPGVSDARPEPCVPSLSRQLLALQRMPKAQDGIRAEHPWRRRRRYPETSSGIGGAPAHVWRRGHGVRRRTRIRRSIRCLAIGFLQRQPATVPQRVGLEARRPCCDCGHLRHTSEATSLPILQIISSEKSGSALNGPSPSLPAAVPCPPTPPRSNQSSARAAPGRGQSPQGALASETPLAAASSGRPAPTA